MGTQSRQGVALNVCVNSFPSPGVAFAILKFSKTFPTILEGKISPGSLVGFQFPIDKWADLGWWQGDVINIFQPPLPESPEPKES